MAKMKPRSFKIEKPERIKTRFRTIDPNEAIILSHLPTKWKWIARDQNGDIYIFTRKPYKGKHYWTTGSVPDNHMFPYRNMFKCIKWSDEDPVNIDKILKENLG